VQAKRHRCVLRWIATDDVLLLDAIAERFVCLCWFWFLAVLVVDATQSIGAMPFSVEDVQPDFLAAAMHKHLYGQSVALIEQAHRKTAESEAQSCMMFQGRTAEHFCTFMTNG